ncbi:hypothetical protein FDP41_005761 [Naegleria fowleri]|uniref:Glutathione S-transferase n=1 Tax=Naegleria fowleri TaxID=5763 RepID=A0A6A5BLG9_NAEFO|nr:uncharacterized protein FDP41_005761 [Naegleria fowleri]KAF0975008.1 hypothetical protein FDP41_005761 [Naegleria fowleri]CAG4719379.1 unnamed protein product [Naegleria fowleri]
MSSQQQHEPLNSTPTIITLYAIRTAASMIPHILLCEMKLQYDIKFLNSSNNEHKSEEYLKINPNGVVPTLIMKEEGGTDELVLFETSAICLYLTDRFPQFKLAPPLNTKERALFYQYLALLSTGIQPDMILFYYPHRYVSSEDQYATFKLETEKRIYEKFKIFDRVLSDGRSYLLGDEFYCVDIYLFILSRWSRNFEAYKARDLPHLGPYLKRIFERESVQQVFKIEEIQEPYY